MAALPMAADFDYNAAVSPDNVVAAVMQLMAEVRSIKSAVELTAASLSETSQKLSSAIATVSNGASDSDNRFGMVKDSVDMSKLLLLGERMSAAEQASSSFETRVVHLEGFSKRVEDIQSAVNDAVKAELINSSSVIAEVTKQVKGLTSSGSELYKTVEQLSSLGFAAIDLRINQGVSEIAGVKHRVQQIGSSHQWRRHQQQEEATSAAVITATRKC